MLTIRLDQKSTVGTTFNQLKVDLHPADDRFGSRAGYREGAISSGTLMFYLALLCVVGGLVYYRKELIELVSGGGGRKTEHGF